MRICTLLFLLLTAPMAWGQELNAGADFAQGVRVGDRVRVETRDGARWAGRVTRVGRGEIAIKSHGQEKSLPGDAIRQVTILRHPFRVAVLAGAAAGATIGALTECRGGPHAECPEGVIVWSALGVGAGVLAARFIDVATDVYPAPRTQTRVLTAVSRSALTVQIIRSW